VCLATPEDFRKAYEKSERNQWAGDIRRKIQQNAEVSISRPMDVPDRGGQWGHWYACRKDGVGLVTDSPIRHRCPFCGTVYTGEPYDSVVIGRVHSANSAALLDLAVSFGFTSQQEFANRAGELLIAYADRYLSYPRHDNNGKDSVTAGRITSQTLDESVWLIPVVWAYTLVRDTLPTASREHIEKDLLYPAAETIIGPSFDNLPNIQCWKNSAIGCVGYALQDQLLVSTALDNPIRGFRVLMAKNVTEGGLWIEGSLGYQQYALRALWPLAEAARRHGTDLYANSNYRSLFGGPVNLALPDGEPPGFNDNPGVPLAEWNEVYELAYSRWKDPAHGRVLRLGPRNTLAALLFGEEKLPEGDPVPKTSIVFQKAGFAALRSPQITVAVRFGLHGGGHGHPDMLNIVTFVDGKLFGVDPGSIDYGAPLHAEWYRSTIAHNTVSVDQQVQSSADGRLLAWSQNVQETSWIGAADVYPGVTLRRELHLNGQRLVDLFTCESATEHVYDWAFHCSGTLSVSIQVNAQELALGSDNGYQHIKQLKQATTDGDWVARWTQGNVALSLHVKGEPGTTIFTGAGPGQNPNDLTALVIIRRKARKTLFAVEHEFQSL
jgi:hypothetical protein